MSTPHARRVLEPRAISWHQILLALAIERQFRRWPRSARRMAKVDAMMTLLVVLMVLRETVN